jgi:glycine/D-amino acid oxidase-like deaminating enzyme
VVPIRGVPAAAAPFRLRRPINEVDFSGGVAAVPLPTLGHIAEGTVIAPIVAAQMRQDAAGRIVLGASLAPAMGDADDDGAQAVPSICRRAIELIPALAEVPIAETRTCVRPVSFDGLPLHGPVDGIDGLVLACGHRSHGLTWGPGSGEAVARGILEGGWDPALSPASRGLGGRGNPPGT